jgi:hypothetical protein
MLGNLWNNNLLVFSEEKQQTSTMRENKKEKSG